MKHLLKGVCAKEVSFTVAAGKLTKVKFYKGCAGNLKALAVLLGGMPVYEVISKLKGITCGEKPTSCSDQLARALKQIKNPCKK